MTTIRTTNNPEMLRWAREEIGLSIEQAAEAIGVASSKLLDAENGESSLTLNQLRKAAGMYECPFGYFYLTQPPHAATFKPVPDFRTEPSHIGKDHYKLNLEIKKARERREVFLELINELGLETIPFRVLENSRAENLGTLIRERLQVSYSDLSALNIDSVYQYWKSKIESDGVLVYESQYIPDVTGVIGAAVYYSPYPIILIKRGGVYNVRKLFTLLHEYAHLLKGKSAINDAESQSIEIGSSEEENIEAECNKLAAEILVPTEYVDINKYKNMEFVEKMEMLSFDFKVTYSTAAVCLKRLGLIDQNDLQYLIDLRKREYIKKTSKPAGTEVRIPRENIVRLDMGKPMFNAVLSAYSNGILDVFDASNILNLRVNKIDKLAGS